MEEVAHSGETKRPAAMAMLKLGWLRKRKKLGATGLAALVHTRAWSRQGIMQATGGKAQTRATG